MTDTSRFLEPMDQTHTLTAGGIYRHARTSTWLSTSVEYGSGTPVGHGGSHEHAEGEADHRHAAADSAAVRVPAHLTGNVALGIDLARDGNGRPKLGLRLDVENVANKPYAIARESQFSPSQYSHGRLSSVTLRWRF